MQVHHGRGYIYSLQYHIVWCVKYRRKVIRVSARLLMKQYGNELKKSLLGGYLWNPSYFIATVSENTEQQVRAYIKKQKEK